MKDSNLIPYACHDITDADIDAVVTALQGEMIAPGPAVETFESDLAATVGARHAVVFNSGTAALHAAYFAAGITVLREDVAAGERITEDNVRTVRLGWGLPLRYQEAVIGMRVSADVRRGTPVSWDVLR